MEIKVSNNVEIFSEYGSRTQVDEYDILSLSPGDIKVILNLELEKDVDDDQALNLELGIKE
ncbi:hypothetical protein HanRHA438_Chr03g0132321 [Helianthus annuus]|nr:hypothetical protein HanRHA438_Chr03g0132321 [Helianthus annuus]